MVGEVAREKRLVFEGRLPRTRSGLTREDLMQNKNGRIVSRKRHAAGKRLHALGTKEGWLHPPIRRGQPLKRGQKAVARQVFTNGVDDAKAHGQAYLENATLSAGVPLMGASPRNWGMF